MSYDKKDLTFVLLYYLIYLTRLISSIKYEHLCEILYSKAFAFVNQRLIG